MKSCVALIGPVVVALDVFLLVTDAVADQTNPIDPPLAAPMPSDASQG